MKKLYFSLIAFLAAVSMSAASFTVTISGMTYVPGTLSVTVGDVVTIEANPNHPLVQVDQSNWNAGTPTPMSGGWGTQSSNYTFTVTNAGTTYFMCQFHGSMGMKGQIVATSATGLTSFTAELKDISVFPNPASEKINLSLNSKSQTEALVNLYSVTGQLLAELKNITLIPGENKFEINLPALANGNYILQVNSENGKISKQISIVK